MIPTKSGKGGRRGARQMRCARSVASNHIGPILGHTLTFLLPAQVLNSETRTVEPRDRVLKVLEVHTELLYLLLELLLELRQLLRRQRHEVDAVSFLGRHPAARSRRRPARHHARSLPFAPPPGGRFSNHLLEKTGNFHPGIPAGTVFFFYCTLYYMRFRAPQRPPPPRRDRP